jgi:UDP-glucose 4-epimerase
MGQESFSPPQVIVTGGSGFVGQHVVRYLASKGYACLVLDQKGPEDPDLQQQIRAGTIRFSRVDLESLPSVEAIRSQVAGKAALVHLASKVDSSRVFSKEAVGTVHDYLDPAFHLMRSLRGKLESVCFISTLETYGFPQYLPIDEFHPTNPFNFYGVGKLMAEHFLSIQCRELHVPLTVFRLSHVYGPGEKYRKAIPLFIEACLKKKTATLLGEGEDERDFIHVDDISRAIHLAIEKKPDGVFNLSGGRPVSMRELLKLIQSLTGSEVGVKHEVRTSEPLRYALSLEKINRQLGYEPKVSLEKGLEIEIRWLERLLSA